VSKTYKFRRQGEKVRKNEDSNRRPKLQPYKREKHVSVYDPKKPERDS
jgi:hypothetical protein